MGRRHKVATQMEADPPMDNTRVVAWCRLGDRPGSEFHAVRPHCGCGERPSEHPVPKHLIDRVVGPAPRARFTRLRPRPNGQNWDVGHGVNARPRQPLEHLPFWALKLGGRRRSRPSPPYKETPPPG